MPQTLLPGCSHSNPRGIHLDNPLCCKQLSPPFITIPHLRFSFWMLTTLPFSRPCSPVPNPMEFSLRYSLYLFARDSALTRTTRSLFAS